MAKTHATYHDDDVSGKKFFRLTPISKVEGTRTKWHCLCDCGNITDVYAWRLINGKTKSCGCYEKENLRRISARNKHGMTDTILYHKWCGIKYRCFNPNSEHYDRYGGRGITMCSEWQGEHGFENFAKWAYSNGYTDSKHGYQQTLDRIDVNGNYEPDNCRWVSQLVQSRNRGNTYYVNDIDGKKMTVKQFDEKHNIKDHYFSYRRFKKGFTAEQILNEWTEHVKFNSDNYYTVETASLYYNVCAETIKIWIHKGLIQAEKNRGKWYIPKDQTKCCI